MVVCCLPIANFIFRTVTALVKIVILRPQPGLNTTEKILELLTAHPEGLTVKEMHLQINRPISWVQTSLKSLMSSRRVRCYQEGGQWRCSLSTSSAD
ncbi:MAG: hypothetical protein KME17_22875 [Cyanosarcina radialis HA8281-LM2]|jgi:hypothetical protein|nr:hypothetical protein [Cyanosarcina radialis HA8281-LM2]